MTVAQILKLSEALSLEEIDELQSRLWSRLVAAGWTPPVSSEMVAELDLRSDEADADPDAGYSWAEVVAGVKRGQQARAAAEQGLARLRAALRNHSGYGQLPFIPSPPEQLARLRRACLHQLGASLPVGYSQLLRRVNGFVFNGLSIYAGAPRPEIHLAGFVEENLGTRIDRPECGDYLLFGHNDMEYLAYRVSDGGYVTTARAGSDVYEIHESFDALLVSALSKVL